MIFGQTFSQFINRIHDAQTETNFHDAGSDLAQALGFRWFAYLSLDGEDRPELISSYERDWTGHYFGCRYEGLDPVVIGARERRPAAAAQRDEELTGKFAFAALGRAIAKRDSDTGAHNYRVAWMAARVGEALGLAGAAMQSLIAGSFLHDAGKIGVPDAILLKPGRLDADELRVMRTHVALGEDIVTGAGWLVAQPVSHAGLSATGMSNNAMR